MVLEFRKKPVTISAVQWTGDNEDEIAEFMRPARFAMSDSGASLYIPTLEGTHEAKLSDWIIKGVKGEFYPCKPDIFEATYDAVPKAQPGVYIAIPARAARAIAEEYQKSIIVIAAWDPSFCLIHITTFGESPADKHTAALVGDRCLTALGGSIAEKMTYEDFRVVRNQG